jgi:outer membrane biosynthesis protein TonB
VKPEWPTDLVTKYRGQTLVVYAVIDTEGKIRRLKMMQSPNIGFNEAIVKALDSWVFRPARLNDKPVAVKGLLGIPISAAR